MFKKKSSMDQAGRRPVRLPAEQRATAVFSYHANRSVRPAAVARGEAPPLTAADVKRRHTRHKWFRRAPVLVGGVLVLVVVVLNLPVQDMPKIVTAKDMDGAIFLRSPAVYQQAAHDLLGGSILNSNKLTINTKRLGHDLQVRFPELAQVMVSLPVIGTRPEVYVVPAQPALILTANDGSAYVLDDTGRALVSLAEVPGVSKLGLSVVKDESNLPTKVGEIILPRTSVTFITEVVGQLKAKNLSIDTLTLPAATSELDVRVKGSAYRVKYNLQGDARAEAGTYLAVRQQLDRTHKMPAEYIDVRVKDRAYYK